MNSQSSQQAVRERADRAARALMADPRVRLVFFFGSAADRERSPASDLNLAVLTESALRVDEVLRLRAEVWRAAGPGIHLVSLNNVAVGINYKVATSGRCLFAREPGLDTEFVVRAILRWLDFKYYLDKYSDIAREQRAELERSSDPQSA